MRVFKSLLVSFFIVAVLSVIFVFVAEIAALAIATGQIKKNLKAIGEDNDLQTYASECMSKGARRNSGGNVHSTQLRFLSDTSYVLEAVCNKMDASPIRIGEEQLPFNVKKLPGQSGFRVGEKGFINLHFLLQTWSVRMVADDVSIAKSQATDLDVVGPSADCVSYGYSCCDETTQNGVGEVMSFALDCPKHCFAQCMERPIIVGFSTQPPYDITTRRLKANSKDSVIFSYVVAADQTVSFAVESEAENFIERFFESIESLGSNEEKEDNQVEVILDYGDGNQEIFSGLRGQAEHQYQCSRGSCEYPVELKVKKPISGAESYPSSQSKINVIVN